MTHASDRVGVNGEPTEGSLFKRGDCLAILYITLPLIGAVVWFGGEMEGEMEGFPLLPSTKARGSNPPNRQSKPKQRGYLTTPKTDGFGSGRKPA